MTNHEYMAMTLIPISNQFNGRVQKSQDRKYRQVRSNVKAFLTVFFNFNGMVHLEFLSQGHTIYKKYY